MDPKVKIAIATHKKYWMPSDSCYLPLHVGRKKGQDIGYIGDDTGDHISWKNPYYCELTGLYWCWKNQPAAYLGLAHYRRQYSVKSWLYRKTHKKEECVMTDEELQELLYQYNVILPKKRNYVIENIRDHYLHTHYREPLEALEQLLKEEYPEYIPYYETVMKRRSAHMFNMYIMRRDLSDAYCEWVFGVLEKLEPRIDAEVRSYSRFQARVYGRLSELLFNVWLEKNIKNRFRMKSIPVIYMEDENWLRKGYRFLKSKFMNQIYEQS
ncbi:MAG: DUF4422 domain-containing protein [Lachnospiraceae bacterium]|nr:DUF4422 domain-containing protein [Lachnospiraceae bacterium]